MKSMAVMVILLYSETEGNLEQFRGRGDAPPWRSLDERTQIQYRRAAADAALLVEWCARAWLRAYKTPGRYLARLLQPKSWCAVSGAGPIGVPWFRAGDRKSTRLNSSH